MIDRTPLILAHKELEKASSLLCQETITRSTVTEARCAAERCAKQLLLLEQKLAAEEKHEPK